MNYLLLNTMKRLFFLIMTCSITVFSWSCSEDKYILNCQNQMSLSNDKNSTENAVFTKCYNDKPIKISSVNETNLLIMIDEKKSEIRLEDIDQDDIYSVLILYNDYATKKYGAIGNNGVLEITTKSNPIVGMQKSTNMSRLSILY